eukprot:CFRG7322T1
MWSWIKSSGIAGSDIPYEIGEPCKNLTPSIWSIHEGRKKEDGSPVTVFIFDGKTKPKLMTIAKTALKRAKTLRHPNFLKLIDSYETDVTITMVTECVVPLVTHIHSINEGERPSQRDDGEPTLVMTKKQLHLECQWGLHQILKALIFLNNDAKMAHNAVSTSTIVVTSAGEWKLGGFDYCCAVNDPEAAFYIQSVPEDVLHYMAPEIRSKGLDPNLPAYVPDMFSLGVVLWEVFHPNNTCPSLSEIRTTKDLTPALNRIIQRCVDEKPSSRPDPARILKLGSSKGSLFSTDFAETCRFLEEMSLKQPEEKSQFFKNLPATVYEFPPRFQKYKILPELVNSLLYSGAQATLVLSIVVKIGKLLNEGEYNQLVIPCVVRLFSANDRATRMALLQNLSEFTEYLSPDVVNEKVFPQIATGFQDVMPALRMESMKASLALIKVLDERNITSVLLKHFSALQVDKEPGIRVNTTICLGKMAEYFSNNTREKVLVHAFTRALKDPFYHARVAGIKAFLATQEYYEATEVASRILPSLALLTVDAEECVRAQAFIAITSYVNVLKKHSGNMPPSPSSVVPANTESSRPAKLATGVDAVESTHGPTEDGTLMSGWGAWAMNSAMTSLSNALTKDEHKVEDIVSSDEQTSQSTSRVHNTRDSHSQKVYPTAPMEDAGNGWGDGNESDEDEPWEAMSTPTSTSSTKQITTQVTSLEIASSNAFSGSRRGSNHTLRDNRLAGRPKSDSNRLMGNKVGADRLGIMAGAPDLDSLLGDSFSRPMNGIASLGRTSRESKPPLRTQQRNGSNSQLARQPAPSVAGKSSTWGEDNSWNGGDWDVPTSKKASTTQVKPRSARTAPIHVTPQASDWSSGWDDDKDDWVDKSKNGASAKNKVKISRDSDRQREETRAKRANRLPTTLGAMKR